MQPGGVFNEKYEQDMAIMRTGLQWVLFACLIILLFLAPLFVPSTVLAPLIVITITIIAIHGLNLLMGYCGQISVGHAAFVLIGAYTSAVLVGKFDFPFILALPCSGILAALAGVFFGLPSLRIKGFYLALATLAAQFIILYIIRHLSSLTGGESGLLVPPASIGGLVFDTDQKFFYLAIVICIIATFLAKSLTRGRLGRAFVAIRDNDLAAEAMGINLYYYKLVAFFLGCLFAGIAGSLWAHYMGGLTPRSLNFNDSVWYLGMIVVGGMGSTMGAIFGTIFITGLKEIRYVYVSPWVSASSPGVAEHISLPLVPMVFSLVVILFLVYEPRGLAHRWELFKAYYRLWPFAY